MSKDLLPKLTSVLLLLAFIWCLGYSLYWIWSLMWRIYFLLNKIFRTDEEENEGGEEDRVNVANVNGANMVGCCPSEQSSSGLKCGDLMLPSAHFVEVSESRSCSYLSSS